MHDVHRVKMELNKGTFRKCKDIHCIARLIKMWFGDLPKRVFSDVKVLKSIIALTEFTSDAIRTILHAMQDPEKSLLQWLLDLCLEVCGNEKINLMGPEAMAVVFAVNLMEDTGDMIMDMKHCKKIQRFLEN